MRTQAMVLAAVSLFWLAAGLRAAEPPIAPAQAGRAAGISVGKLLMAQPGDPSERLTDGSGRTLYTFDRDLGEPGSTCAGPCAHRNDAHRILGVPSRTTLLSP